jgi:hypothetical protein
LLTIKFQIHQQEKGKVTGGSIILCVPLLLPFQLNEKIVDAHQKNDYPSASLDHCAWMIIRCQTEIVCMVASSLHSALDT